MLRNYILMTVRRIYRSRVVSAINIIGLGVGIACFMLSLLIIHYETSVDTHHENYENIYRFVRETRTGDRVSYSSKTSGALSPALEADFPEIKLTTKIFSTSSALLKLGQNNFKQTVWLVNHNFFRVFTFPFQNGHWQKLSSQPYTIVISEKIAKKLFGNENPIGRTLSVRDLTLEGDYIIVGVYSTPPSTSMIQFDCLTMTVPPKLRAWDRWIKSNGLKPFQTYALLNHNRGRRTIEKRLPQFVKHHLGSNSETTIYHLQPLKEIYLYHFKKYGELTEKSGNILHLYLVASVAIFILFIACVNFLNLTTAMSLSRGTELNMRKIVGANRIQLFTQFLIESIIWVSIALFLATILSHFSFPFIASAIGKNLVESALNFGRFHYLFLCVLSIIILSGCYPAHFLYNRNKTNLKISSSNLNLRKAMVLFQFLISTLLIFMAIIVFKQLNYIQKKELGFDKENVVVLDIFRQNRNLREHYSAIKQTFTQHPNINKATVTRFTQGSHISRATFFDVESNQTWDIGTFDICEDYLDFFDIRLIEGDISHIRNSVTAFAESDEKLYHFIINESTAKKMNWKYPIGKRIEMKPGGTGIVVGVMEDFHMQPLYNSIEPMILRVMPFFSKFLYLKIREGKFKETIKFIHKEWNVIEPNYPFTYYFLDEYLTQSLYRKELNLSQVIILATVFGVLISGTGLFALVTFMVEQRTKEIGIRKVLGASYTNLSFILSKELIKMILFASCIAWPFGWFIGSLWLQNFVYRIDIGISIFVIGTMCILGISLLIIVGKILSAIKKQPIDTLRYE